MVQRRMGVKLGTVDRGCNPAVLQGMTSMYTDIAAHGWVARLPPRARPYALLLRLDRPIGAWLLFLPGLWGLVVPGGCG